MKSKATAVWNGGLKDGTGTVSAGNSAFLDAPYNFGKRFEGAAGAGTTPEELIAAAHSSCFAMAFSADLGRAGFTPQRIMATATVTLEPVEGKPTVTSSHLVVSARVPGIDAGKFNEVAEGARANCPIARLLNTKITLEATLEK